MAELIPSISLTQFRKLLNEPGVPKLKRLKSCEITKDDEYIGTWVNGMVEPSGYLRKQTEYNSQRGNAVGGETLEEILGRPVAV